MLYSIVQNIVAAPLWHTAKHKFLSLKKPIR